MAPSPERPTIIMEPACAARVEESPVLRDQAEIAGFGDILMASDSPEEVSLPIEPSKVVEPGYAPCGDYSCVGSGYVGTDDAHEANVAKCASAVVLDPRVSMHTLADQKLSQDDIPAAFADLKKEYVRSLMAFSFLCGVIAFLIFGLPYLGKHFKEPTCEREVERSCEPCGRGTMILPLYGNWENTWPRWLRVPLYLFGVFWAFLGVGLVCDYFMEAIEAITTGERTVWVEVHPGARRRFKAKIWNDTIANLSLMSLGSSAPEILLSATELAGNKYFSGRLGPSTIVGSAAFNLFVISAICVSAIPAPGTKNIERLEVFTVTTTISIIAYLWLLVMLLLWTPDKVEVEEGIITLCGFPALLILAYAADRGWLFRSCFRTGRQSCSARAARLAMEEEIQSRYGKELPLSAVQKIRECEMSRKTLNVSKAQARRDIIAQYTGGSRVSNFTAVQLLMTGGSLITDEKNKPTQICIVGFKEERYVVLECAGKVLMKIVCLREPGHTFDIYYSTKEGTALKNVRYKHTEGVITFYPRQTEATIEIPIIDNDKWDPDEEFYVYLDKDVPNGQNSQNCVDDDGFPAPLPSVAFSSNHSMPSVARNLVSMRSSGCAPRISGYRRENVADVIKIGQKTATVTVLNDDMPGVLDFDADEVQTTAGSVITLFVQRRQGSVGRIQCKYMTEPIDAIAGRQYMSASGTLVFEDGEANKEIKIVTVAVPPEEWHTPHEHVSLKVVLREPSPGVKFDPNSTGGEREAFCEIMIITGLKIGFLRRIANSFEAVRGLKEWANQAESAFFCNGCPEDQAEAGIIDWIMHVLTLFWKMMFILIPPTVFAGGWLCFWAALVMIGVVTLFVGELSSLLGCVIGIPDEITAISLVALGTSLPDTFASKVAAQQEPTADNSIGNIMGSNSVNVFLGLGISWTLGALHWRNAGVTEEWKRRTHHGKTFEDLYLKRYNNGGFMVPSGTLLFSVSVYTGFACICVGILFFRRARQGGELGGSKISQLRDSFLLMSLWFFYLAATSMYAGLFEK